jgi:hypothetical protein
MFAQPVLKVIDVWKQKKVLDEQLVEALASEVRKATDLVGQVKHKERFAAF